jgi:hypothetical protein
MCVCLNCPDKPTFITHEAFEDHWKATHTVPVVATIELPEPLKAFFPEITAKKVNLHKEIPDT